MHKKGEKKYLLLLLLQCFDLIIKQHILKSGVSSFRVTAKSRNNYQLFSFYFTVEEVEPEAAQAYRLYFVVSLRVLCYGYNVITAHDPEITL